MARRPPRPPRRDRLAGGAALQAFTWGVDQLEPDWDVVAKVDGDLRLTPATLGTLETAFLRDAALGVAGAFLSAPDGAGRPLRQRLPRDHVEGETKFYRRECWQEIEPLPAMLGWDTIDLVRARLRGWRTQSFEIPGGDPLHLRPMGAHDGRLRGYRRWGRCAWSFGEHPLHVLAVAAQRARDEPALLGALNYVAGWAAAAAGRAPRAEAEVREYVRRDQLRRLRRRLARERGRRGSGMTAVATRARLLRESADGLRMARAVRELWPRDDWAGRVVRRALVEALGQAGGRREPERIRAIEALRRELAASDAVIERIDFGAGDGGLTSQGPDHGGVEVVHTIGDFCQGSCIGPAWSRVLFHLVREAAPVNALELGTGLGLSAAYQGAALELNGHGRLMTIEGAVPLADIARVNLARLGITTVEVVTGRFREALPPVLERCRPLELRLHRRPPRRTGHGRLLPRRAGRSRWPGHPRLRRHRRVLGDARRVGPDLAAPAGDACPRSREARRLRGGAMTPRLHIAVVVPFLDEAEHLPVLLESLAAQQRPPDRVILVDDGSSDGSDLIAQRFALDHPQALVAAATATATGARPDGARARVAGVHVGSRARRRAVGPRREARRRPEAYPAACWGRWRAASSPSRGSGSPARTCRRRSPTGDSSGSGAPPGHVEGPNRFYRRACLEAISPIPAILGWDTIDEVRARMRGWETRSFESRSGDVVHLRRLGSYDGVLRGYGRAGWAAYAYGAHPLHVLGSAAARCRDRPRVACGTAYLGGYAAAVVLRAARAEPEARARLRREQRARLSALALGRAMQ